MSIIKQLLRFSALAVTLSLTSCVATETLESPGENEKENRIVLHLAPATDGATRADNNYKLRYVAQLFEGEMYNNVSSTPLQRSEIIEGEDNNQIIFNVTPNKYYILFVFADYIPAESQPIAGLYNDYFYDTHTTAKSVSMLTTPASSATKVSAEFFNNGNYDCFFSRAKLYKEESSYELTMTLKRITAQVSFRDNSTFAAEGTVNVNKLGLRSRYDFNLAQTIDPSSTEFNGQRLDINLNEPAQVTSTEREIFYFYTLADEGASGQYVATQFGVNQNGTEGERITVQNIPVRANFRTIVKGSYLKDLSQSQNPGDDKPSEPSADGIILNLGVDKNWEQQSLEK